MYSFTFTQGKWEEGNKLPKWNDGEEFVEYLKRIGYQQVKTIYGSEDGGGIEVYESMEGNSFYANVEPTNGAIYEVYIPDFPSLMMFLKDYAAVFCMRNISETQQYIESVVEKYFQAQHGHAAHNICPECDPVGWKNMQEFRNKKQSNNG
jgi:hypothetical protein